MDSSLIAFVVTAMFAVPPAFVQKWRTFLISLAAFGIVQIASFRYLNDLRIDSNWNDSAGDMFIPLVALLPTALMLVMLALRLMVHIFSFTFRRLRVGMQGRRPRADA